MEGEWRERLAAEVGHLLPELASLARFLYDHPELAYHEFKAQKAVAELLETHGLPCEMGVGGEKTAFRAWSPDVPSGSLPGPVVAILAEYDALPEIGHGCGHNLSAAAAVGAAIAVKQALPELAGRVVLVGTPAEEVPPSTKGAMHKAGAFAGVDAVLMMHPDDRTTTKAGALALSSFDFVFTGKPSHAAKYPHLGVSALDAALLCFTALEFLREHVPEDVRLHGIITEGGSRPSVVPDRAVIRYYARAQERPLLDTIIERVLGCARAGALATGAGLEIVHLSSQDNLLLVPVLNDILEENAADAGAVQVMPASTSWGSNDLGDLSHHLPTSKLKTAFVPVGSPNHTREWAQASVTPAGTAAVAVAAKAMAITAVRLITEPDLLAAVKTDFAAQRAAAARRAGSVTTIGR